MWKTRQMKNALVGILFTKLISQSVRHRMVGGGLLSIVAFGAQDIYLKAQLG